LLVKLSTIQSKNVQVKNENDIKNLIILRLLFKPFQQKIYSTYSENLANISLTVKNNAGTYHAISLSNLIFSAHLSTVDIWTQWPWCNLEYTSVLFVS